MSEQNEKLTAEEKRLVVELENIALSIDHEGPLSDRDTGEEMAAKIRLYAAQQVEHATADLSDLLERNRCISTKFQMIASERSKQVKKLNAETAELRKELEVLNKKYRREVGICELYKERAAEAQRQRDGAVELLKDWHSETAKGKIKGVASFLQSDTAEFLSRLSSGETKPANEMPTRHEQDCYTRGICPECYQNLPSIDEQP